VAVFSPVPDGSNHAAINARHVVIQIRFMKHSLVNNLVLALERHATTDARNFAAKDVALA
jgi:hypothetical protein